MESALAGSVTIAGKLYKVIENEYNKQKALVPEVESIKADLEMFEAFMDDYTGKVTAVSRLHGEVMLDLRHDLDDFLDRFIHCLTCKQSGGAWPFSQLKKIHSHSCFAKEIRELKKRLELALKRFKDVYIPANTSFSAQPTESTRSASSPVACDLVGIVKPVEELLCLLDEVEGEPDKLRVVSVVGFGGLGKTTLVRAVYKSIKSSDLKNKFNFLAWVSAGRSRDINSEEGVMGILRRKLRKVLREDAMDVDLVDYLKDRRYLIIIDDIGMEESRVIKSTFQDNGASSRILVTTTLQPVANICSNGNGYVYQMSTLGEEDSKKIVLQGSPELEQDSITLLQKCDGLPLALVSVCEYLKSLNGEIENPCAKLCNNLGSHLKENHGHANFAELTKVLLDNYDSLSGYTLTCLMYLSIFPNNRPLKKNVVIRRWLAEGYARSDTFCNEEDIADENFKKIMDRNIIHPVEKRNNTQVKTCRTHGIVHEFMLHKSMSQKFVGANASNARHLCVHGGGGANGGPTSTTGLSRVRSLTVFGDAGEAISYVRKCKLLRVLDLEECDDLKEDHLKHICKLWHLKYLSFGGTILRKLPRCIEGLHCLETLDLRRSKIKTLPMEAIELPHLAHLLGRLMLDKDDLKNAKKISKLGKFLSGKKSNLQTLAGFLTNRKKGFLQFIGQMKKLRKVKIWCEPTINGTSYSADLLHAIQEFTKVRKDMEIALSLTIHAQKCSEALLSLLDFEQMSEGPEYALRSLKLCGELPRLPPFVILLSDLTELYISSANLTGDLLSALIILRSLRFLTLTAGVIENFEWTKGAFPILRCLCLVVQSLTPALLTIEQGAMPILVSLMFRGPVGLSDIEIRHLKHLNEVTVDHGVTEQTKQDWERAAKNHPNRPRLIFHKSVVDPIERNGLVQETFVLKEKRKRCLVQPCLDDELVSGIKKMRISVLEPCSSRLGSLQFVDTETNLPVE